MCLTCLIDECRTGSVRHAHIYISLQVDPMFAFMYLFMPHLETINYLSAINYTWHAFADPDDVDNECVCLFIFALTFVD